MTRVRARKPSRAILALLCSSASLALACGAPAEHEGVDPNSLTECVITSLDGPSVPTGSYVKTRRIVTDSYVFEIDEATRSIRVSGGALGEPEWYWTTTYDEVGHMSRLEHRDGTLVDFANTYDGTRILATETIVLVPGQGTDPGTVEYLYEDTEHPELWTRAEAKYRGAQPSTNTWLRTAEAGHVVRAEQWSPDAEAAQSIWTYTYEGDTLATIERDQGFWEPSDGTSDVRFSWLRDGEGRLRTFEQDGTDHNDYPHIDGVADFQETFSPGCDELLEQHPWLSHAPDRDEVTPGFRAPTIWRPKPAR